MRELIYNVDRWTAYLWKRLLKDSALVRDHVAHGKKKVPTFDSFAREVFARLYARPKALERTRPEDAWARALHTVLDELPSFAKLAAHCMHDKELASAATATVLEELVEKLPEKKANLGDPEARRREVRGLLDFLKTMNADDPARASLEAQIEAAKAAGKEAVAALSDVATGLDADAMRLAMRRTIDDAAVEVEELVAASAGLSGLGGTSHVSDDTRALLGTTLKAAPALKKLGLLAGRMRSVAVAKRRSKTKQAASELSDITTGGDLARLLPHELMKLTDPLLSLDFLRGFLERSLLQYELTGNERQGRGPMVVLIDDSDSMDGAPATFARAAALALADLALADRRACRLVRFSHKLNATIDLRPGRSETRELLTFLAGPVDGGTSFELPLRAARDAIDREPCYERADVILITDGEAELGADFIREWRQRAAREGLSTYAIHIGSHAPAVLRALTIDVIELRTLVPEALDETLFAAITAR